MYPAHSVCRWKKRHTECACYFDASGEPLLVALEPSRGYHVLEGNLGGSMESGDRDNLKLWAETWAKAGPRLEAIADRELREMTYEERVQAIASLVEIGCKFAVPTTTSGLVEMQRIFRRARR
jgi:hypothetical protein